MKQLLILNAPPRAGKDTIADHLEGWHRREFKGNLIDTALQMALMSYVEWNGRYDLEAAGGLWMKDIPWGRLGGLSQRQYLIWLSEKIMKPLFGKSVFGQRFKDDLDFESDMCGRYRFVAPDGGFVEEVQPFLDDPEWEVIIVRLSRVGCTFEGDSRNYLSNISQHEVDIENNTTIVDAIRKIEQFTKHIKENK